MTEPLCTGNGLFEPLCAYGASKCCPKLQNMGRM
jgi:hypothetical protein